jgi:hypothetical protein
MGLGSAGPGRKFVNKYRISWRPTMKNTHAKGQARNSSALQRKKCLLAAVLTKVHGQLNDSDWSKRAEDAHKHREHRRSG